MGDGDQSSIQSGGVSNVPVRDKMAFGWLVTFAAAMYMAPGAWMPELAPLRVALVSSSLAIGLMFFGRLGRREAIFLDGQRGITLIAFALYTAASIGWSLFPAQAQLVAIDCLKYVAIYVTIVNLVTTPKRAQWLAAAMVLGAIITANGAIDWYLRGEDLVEGFRARWVGVYADPNRLAMSLQLVIPLAAALMLRKTVHPIVRIGSLVSAILCVVAIVFSHSRGGFIGLAVSMVLWTLLSENKLPRFVILGLAFVSLLIFAPDSFWNRTETVGQFHEDASAMGRVHAWTVASRINEDKPLLGVGAGSFRVAWPLYAPPEATRAYEAHNVFLQVLAELGLLGFILFVLFLGGTLEGAMNATKDPEVGWLARAVLAASAGYLVCNLTAGFLGSSPHFYVLFGLAAATERVARMRTSNALVPVKDAGPPAFATEPQLG